MTSPATFTHRPWHGVGALASLTAGLTLMLAAPAQAQFSNSAEALEQNSSGSSDLFQAEESPMRTPFDLYHRANLANTRTPEEFMQQQRSVLGSEIQNLRMQQQQLLQGQPTQPAMTPEPAAEESLVP
jgi:hypothetical protein